MATLLRRVWRTTRVVCGALLIGPAMLADFSTTMMILLWPRLQRLDFIIRSCWMLFWLALSCLLVSVCFDALASLSHGDVAFENAYMDIMRTAANSNATNDDLRLMMMKVVEKRAAENKPKVVYERHIVLDTSIRSALHGLCQSALVASCSIMIVGRSCCILMTASPLISSIVIWSLLVILCLT